MMSNELNQQKKVARMDKSVVGGCAFIADPEPCGSGEFYTGLRYNVAKARGIAKSVADMSNKTSNV